MRWRMLFMHLSFVPVQILGYSPIPVWWKLGVQLQRWRISSYAASKRQLDISYLKNGAQLTKGLLHETGANGPETPNEVKTNWHKERLSKSPKKASSLTDLLRFNFRNILFKNVPVEFLGQVFQAQFTFKVTAPVCGIESISGFVCGGG